MLLDALCISKDQALPQQGIALPEAVCDLPAAHNFGHKLSHVSTYNSLGVPQVFISCCIASAQTVFQ